MVRVVAHMGQSADDDVVGVVPVAYHLEVIHRVASEIEGIFGLDGGVILICGQGGVAVIGSVVGSHLEIGSLAVFAYKSRLPPLLVNIVLYSSRILIVFRIFVRFNHVLEHVEGQGGGPAVVVNDGIALYVFYIAVWLIGSQAGLAIGRLGQGYGGRHVVHAPFRNGKAGQLSALVRVVGIDTDVDVDAGHQCLELHREASLLGEVHGRALARHRHSRAGQGRDVIAGVRSIIGRIVHERFEQLLGLFPVFAILGEIIGITVAVGISYHLRSHVGQSVDGSFFCECRIFKHVRRNADIGRIRRRSHIRREYFRVARFQIVAVFVEEEQVELVDALLLVVLGDGRAGDDLLRQHVLADGLDGESVAGRNGTAAKVLLRGAGCRQEHGGHRQEIIKYLFHLYAVFGCCFIG